MMNNKGFGKFEIITLFAIMIIAFAIGGYVIIQKSGDQKFDVMKKNALSFANAVTTNISSFHSSDVVYLEEAIDEKILSNIKNPFGGGNCDVAESRVNNRNGKTYVTLKCGNYLINEASLNNIEDVNIYNVSEWNPKTNNVENAEERKLYNCIENGKEIFDRYLEESIFVYEYNKRYGTDYYFINNIVESDLCELVSNDFYRTINNLK